MEKELRCPNFYYSYLDDLVIDSSSLSSTSNNIQLVLESLIEHDFLINPYKCIFRVTEVDFLCHHINSKVAVLSKVKCRLLKIFQRTDLTLAVKVHCVFTKYSIREP